jgi:RHS repeat-associated protein
MENSRSFLFHRTRHETKAIISHIHEGKRLAAEYSTQIETEAPKVSYLTTDHLGSPRIATDASGGVISRKDFTAFGEEVVTAQRTSGDEGNGYDPPNVRQDYTGYQKDLESGLEFAQARYYNTRHGRFTSVDPLAASQNTDDPQTFNRYTYVMNKPTSLVDPSGAIGIPPGCSAGFSFSDCGGGSGFWGGSFGNATGVFNRRYGGLSKNIARGMMRRHSIDRNNYDPELGHFLGDVIVQSTIGGKTRGAILTNPTLEQVEDQLRVFSKLYVESIKAKRRAELERLLPNTEVGKKMVNRRAVKGTGGFTFEVTDKAGFKAILTGGAFRTGIISPYHLKDAQCGSCKDYRSDEGAIPGISGSMQITYNEEKGIGFVDVDRFSPFQDVRGFFGHVFLEVMRSDKGGPYPQVVYDLATLQNTYDRTR